MTGLLPRLTGEEGLVPAKIARDNIDANELAALRKSARVVLALPQAAIDVEVASGRLTEVFCGDEEVS
jgi:hypothetical protein